MLLLNATTFGPNEFGSKIELPLPRGLNKLLKEKRNEKHALNYGKPKFRPRCGQ